MQTFTMEVDRTFERSLAGPTKGGEELRPENYRAVTPSARWRVAVDGTALVLTSLTGEPAQITGKQTAMSPEERRFTIDVWAGGYFSMRGDEAQLTWFGSGVHVARSERGKLVPAP